ncbi:hypothetical protein ACN47E_005899 [Coniothyrium glycines]
MERPQRKLPTEPQRAMSPGFVSEEPLRYRQALSACSKPYDRSTYAAPRSRLGLPLLGPLIGIRAFFG